MRAEADFSFSLFLADLLDALSDELFLSTVTVIEIGDCITELKRNGGGVRAYRLDDWPGVVLHIGGEWWLRFDVSTARLAYEPKDQTRTAAHVLVFGGLAISAKAGFRLHAVLTRDLLQISPVGIPVIGPYVSVSVRPRPSRIRGRKTGTAPAVPENVDSDAVRHADGGFPHGVLR